MREQQQERKDLQKTSRLIQRRDYKIKRNEGASCKTIYKGFPLFDLKRSAKQETEKVEVG
ncbi:hypothetical protein ACT7C6_08335 [Bacillus paranthracis]